MCDMPVFLHDYEPIPSGRIFWAGVSSSMAIMSRRRWSVLLTLLLVAAVSAGVVLVTRHAQRSARPNAAPAVPSQSLTPTAMTSAAPAFTSPRPTPSTPARPRPTVRSRAATDAAVRTLAAPLGPTGVSVAALNLATGARYSGGATNGMRIGSLYKLLVLETLLLQHQDTGTPMTESELELAAPMIAQSENKTAYQLFLDVGGNSGFATGAARLGMTHTVPGQTDPTLTASSAPDGLAMLAGLVGKGQLNSYSRSVVFGLMSQIEREQRWGVSVVSDPGAPFMGKNGWLSVDNDNGPDGGDNDLWLATSAAIVRVHGQQVLMAVYTQHNPDYQSGVDLVEALARAIVPAVVAR